MTELAESVHAFLIAAGYSAIDKTRSPFQFAAQGSATLVFTVDAGEQLQKALDEVAKSLVSPFRSKAYGPKTLEMYVVLIASPTVPFTEIERCEHDTSLCRKIVITATEEIPQRLSFLRPLEHVTTGPADIEALFWNEVGRILPDNEVRVLRAIAVEKVSIVEAIARARNAK